MSEIIGIDKKKREQYDRIVRRLYELDGILGFSRDQNGDSLSKRARRDSFSEKLFTRIREHHPEEMKEHMSLTAQAVQLEDELGITDEYIKLLEETVPSDGYFPDIW